jgi:RNA polymerase sigma-70 factor (ECF subfamily)
MLVVYLAMLETENDRQKFTQLYNAYEKKIYAVTLRILGNPSQAEDAVQQAWLHLLQHWERVSALNWESAGGYAVTTAKNAALDILRSENRTGPFPTAWEPPARSDNQDEYQYLISLIQALPEIYRRILELKCIEEESNREIAKRLKINEATVATRARRGRMMLKEQLEKEGFYA